MKILELQIQGYRSLKDVLWKPDSLNVVIGPNGSGKSNLLRVLQLLNAAAGKRLAKRVQEEGGMEPIVWDGKARHITMRLKTSGVDPTSRSDRENLTYNLQLDRLGKSSAYRVGMELLGNYYQVDKGERQSPFKFLERDSAHAVIFDMAERELRAPPESVPETEALLAVAPGPLSANRVIDSFQEHLAAWGIYHGFHAGSDSPARQGTVSRYDLTLEPAGDNLVSVLHTLYTGSREFKRDLNEAMQAAFGPDFEELAFPPEADQRVQLRMRWKSLSREQSGADLSDGTLRFLFILAILANPKPPSLIAIDEPETGLHPAMQRIVAEFAVDAATRSQVVLTTHSPEFLDAFDKTIPRTTVAEWHEGETRLRNLAGDALEAWLQEYSLGDVLRTNEADVMAEETGE